MEKITKIFALLLVFSVVFMTSCNKDDELGTATQEQAEAAIEQGALQFDTDMAAIMDSDGGLALASLIDLNAPFFGDVNFKSVKDIKNLTKVVEAEFGTYEWNPNYYSAGVGEWEYEALPIDKLVMIFPTTGSATNNAELTVTNFEFVEVGFDSWPTRLVLDIDVDGVTQVEIDLTATWSNDGMPLSVVVTVFLNPYTITGSFTTTSNSATANVSVVEGTTTIISAGLTATFAGTAMSDSPSNLDGYLQYRTLKLQGNIQIAAMEDLLNVTYDPTPAQLNALFNLYLVDISTGNKLGDFMAIEDEFGYTDLAFVFADGTVATDAFTSDLTDMIEEMIGPGY